MQMTYFNHDIGIHQFLSFLFAEQNESKHNKLECEKDLLPNINTRIQRVNITESVHDTGCRRRC